MDRPPKPTGDLTELCAIHRHLFQDLYDWAGQVRTVDIRTNVEGAEFFIALAAGWQLDWRPVQSWREAQRQRSCPYACFSPAHARRDRP
jgi:fido (protein-threonine AMPylation protein)